MKYISLFCINIVQWTCLLYTIYLLLNTDPSYLFLMSPLYAYECKFEYKESLSTKSTLYVGKRKLYYIIL